MGVKDDTQMTLDSIFGSEENGNRQEATPTTLPDWFDGFNAAPCALIRSSLFAVVKRGQREHLSRQELSAWGDVRIAYSGEQLNQRDLDVWLELVSLYQGTNPEGCGQTFTAYSFLKRMGKRTSKRDYEFLRSAFDRMTACALHVRCEEYVYTGPLITDYYRNDETGEYEVFVNPTIAALFDDGWTQINVDVRRSFNSDMDKWFHFFLSSHRITPKRPLRVGLEKLQNLCGSRSRQMRTFRQTLRRSLARLEKSGVVDEGRWEIKNDILHVRA